MIIFYAISALSCILMLSYGLNHTESLAFPAIFLLCRFATGG
jgi:hypothetical protein